ncbi:MAG: hypothetical protein KKG02_11495 [Candidatus Edwardsbacteria bacterium]|nr:hypothetical protein [Candidatus Edwardsbacteria bacterium]
MSNTVINRDELSYDSIASILENAYIDYEWNNDKAGILVNIDTNTTLLTIDEEKRYIRYLGYTPVSESGEYYLKIKNNISAANEKFIMACHTLLKNDNGVYVIVSTYYLWTDGGLVPKNFISSLKYFNKVIMESLLYLVNNEE